MKYEVAWKDPDDYVYDHQLIMLDAYDCSRLVLNLITANGYRDIRIFALQNDDCPFEEEWCENERSRQSGNASKEKTSDEER